MTVDAKGLLKVAPEASPSTTNLLATVEEEVGLNLYTSWVIEVRPVHYLVLQGANHESSWIATPGSVFLPRGGALDLEVSCHDALGRKFAACPMDLKTRPSRFDLTKLTPAGSTKMGLSLLGNGYTVLKIKDGLTGLEAWAVTQVGNSINVPSVLSVGDVVQLSSNIQQLNQGSWSVEPAGQMYISPTGLAIARRSGPARVKLSTKQGDSFYSDVTIGGASAVSFPADLVVTCKDEPRIIPFNFVGGVFSVSEETVDSKAIVKCRLSSSSLDTDGFSVKSVLTSSGWGCEFTCTASPGDLPGSMTVSIETPEGAVGTLGHIEYVPPFSVSSPVLEVGPGGSHLRVSGHRDVLTGLTTRSEGVHLSSWWLEDNQLILPVSLVSPIQHESWVQIQNPSTGDMTKVTILPVIDPSYSQESSFLGVDTGFLYTITIGIAIGCILITKFIPKPSSPPPPPSKDSPSRSEPSAAPTSPQPYLWSVDNSPIYGSPLVQRSPPANARNLTTYSYS